MLGSTTSTDKQAFAIPCMDSLGDTVGLGGPMSFRPAVLQIGIEETVSYTTQTECGAVQHMIRWPKQVGV